MEHNKTIENQADPNGNENEKIVVLAQIENRNKKKKKNFQCNVCEESYRCNLDLVRHFNAVHLNLKPYKCTLCELSFGWKTALATHKDIVHQKVARYFCQSCDYKSYKFGNVKRHNSRKHLKSLSKCGICGEEFKSTYLMKKTRESVL